MTSADFVARGEALARHLEHLCAAGVLPRDAAEGIADVAAAYAAGVAEYVRQAGELHAQARAVIDAARECLYWREEARRWAQEAWPAAQAAIEDLRRRLAEAERACQDSVGVIGQLRGQAAHWRERYELLAERRGGA